MLDNRINPTCTTAWVSKAAIPTQINWQKSMAIKFLPNVIENGQS